MKKRIITIARQYGSGGREVGQILAELTGYKFYDKNLITLAAQKSGLSPEALGSVDEKATSSLLYTLALGSSVYNHGIDVINLPINDRLFAIQSEIIRELADGEEGAIIVGRCADHVLRDRDDLVCVFLSADFDTRVKTIMKRHELSDTSAKDLIIKTDKRRANYYNYYTGQKWGKLENFDLAVDSARLGIETTADMLYEYVKFYQKTKMQ